MAGLMDSIRRRNKALGEATAAARSARTGNSARPKPGPKVGAKTRAKPARRGLQGRSDMQTNLPITRQQNRPQSISGADRRQQRMRDIERRIKELGG